LAAEPEMPATVLAERVGWSGSITWFRENVKLLGSWELIGQLGRVPRRLIWDNELGIGRGLRRAEGVTAFMGRFATKLVLLKPRDPESKGIVERRNGSPKRRSIEVACLDSWAWLRRPGTRGVANL
jgi:hypothetical protein